MVAPRTCASTPLGLMMVPTSETTVSLSTVNSPVSLLTVTCAAVAVQVAVPDGEELDRVEIYLNETRVATLYQPPFTQPILLPEQE